MILYHGSNMTVSRPRLIRQDRNLDFGSGFYTTTQREQAAAFAKKVAARRKEGIATLNIYSLNEEETFAACRLLRFHGADEAWLDFVCANRNGSYRGPAYDLVYGAVANDDVYRSVTLYLTGVLTKEQTIAALKIKKLFDQLVFTSEKSLQYLHFERSETL